MIATIGIAIYARAFKLAPPYMAPEVYISYAEQLSHGLKGMETGSRGLNTRDPKIELRLKQVSKKEKFT